MSTDSPELTGASFRRPDAIDLHIAARIRQRRLSLGLTQKQMAELTGITYQQGHKYETGVNRISAGRLYVTAQALKVDVAYFFEGAQATPLNAANIHGRLILELARNFVAIRNPKQQAAVLALSRVMASGKPDLKGDA